MILVSSNLDSFRDFIVSDFGFAGDPVEVLSHPVGPDDDQAASRADEHHTAAKECNHGHRDEDGISDFVIHGRVSYGVSVHPNVGTDSENMSSEESAKDDCVYNSFHRLTSSF